MRLCRNSQRRRALFEPVAKIRSEARSSTLPVLLDDFSRCARGASAIEFAIIAPVFVALVLGIIGYGLYLGTAHSLAQLTADAARASVAGLTDAERSLIVSQHVQTNASHYPLLDTRKLITTSGVVTDAPDQFSVVLTYDSSQLPIWHFDKLVPLPPKVLRRTATIQRGGY